VAVKLSGLVTEADWDSWTPGQLRPVMEYVLERFGPDRTMFGRQVASALDRFATVVPDEAWTELDAC